MKSRELRKLNPEDLLKLKKDLEFELVRTKSTGTIDQKKLNIKGASKSGEKTSLQKEVRRTIAKILTIIREREIESNKK